MNNGKSLLDLREMLFKLQKRKEQYGDLRTFKSHLEHYLGFEVKCTYDKELDHLNAFMLVQTMDKNEIHVSMKLSQYNDQYVFTHFEVETQRQIDFSKQEKILLMGCI
jgi:hypothetical protein